MSGEPTYETQRIDHLGIVAGVCQESSLIEQIDGQVKASERKMSCGKGAQAMVLNALGFFGRALYLTPDYFENKPVDLLIGILGRMVPPSCKHGPHFRLIGELDRPFSSPF